MFENNSNNNSNSNMPNDTAIHEREGTKTSLLLHQNSNSSGNSCSSTVKASSPNNGSDHSNSSNTSLNISQPDASDTLQDLGCRKISKNKNSNFNAKDEDIDKSCNMDMPSKSNFANTKAINALKSVKEESNTLNTLGSVLVNNEENIAPSNMSPVGFGSIVSTVPDMSVEGVGQAVTPVKCNELTNRTSSGNCTNNYGNDKLKLGINTSDCGFEDVSISTINSNYDICGRSSQNLSSNTLNNSASTGSSQGNCMDYMQQQNHIFVFSTQLANKGAESVLSGQFPTIIAYHCMQPATKSFLEDFFIKNPLKMSKLQRQNSLNLGGVSVSGGQEWITGCTNSLKIQHILNGGKSNFSTLNTTVDKKLHLAPLRPHNIVGFPESFDSVVPGENDVICWEQARINTERSGSAGSRTEKKLDGAESVDGSQRNATNLNKGNSVDICNENNVPSLQGVKVPDENLTPQQRQHREEQLAKLKKMNQFLFPENGSDYRNDPSNQLCKLKTNCVPGNIAGIILNLPASAAAAMELQLCNPPGPAIRTTPSSQSKSTACNSENIAVILGDDTNLQSEIMDTHEIGGVLGTVKSNSGSMDGVDAFAVMPDSPDGILNFSENCGSSDEKLKVTNSKAMVPYLHSQDMNQVGLTQMEWSKLQHQFIEARLKGNKSSVAIGCMPASSTGVSNIRSSHSGPLGNSVAATSYNQTVNRSAQGPPPPYHSTQRSASVPIATQSPNPASPNNPTSNLSLPSPRTSSGAIGILSSSPNMDVNVPSTLSTITTIATNTKMENQNAESKSTFQQEGSPTGGNGSNIGNTNRNRSNPNQCNSNPSTPLSQLSPKDLESFNLSASSGDQINAHPSPQRPGTPLMTPNNNTFAEAANSDGRFLPVSPGLNFATHMQSTSGAVGTYKAPVSNERQNSAPMPSLFCRRTDNLPLNPNSSRPPQNKLNVSFDPISSLAQMSQQLTSSVSLNTGVGNGAAGIGAIAPVDINMPSNVNQNMESMMTLDSGLDHCSPGSSGNMNIPPHMIGASQFMSSNCHLNSVLGPMSQRLLSSKMCGSGGGFNPSNSGMREVQGSFHGMMPSHRMMNRMAANFGNFNLSPNIHVKASTPNTIQYMPVRTQNSNASNMRVPPSLEFLQRYANPTMSGSPNTMDSGPINQVSPSGASNDPNKTGNNGSHVGGKSTINFYQNCNQMVGLELEDIPNGILPSHDMNLGSHAPFVHGIRPVRQHNLGHTGSVSRSGSSRTHAPSPNIIGPVIPQQFPRIQQESMECNDTEMFAVNAASDSSSQMYAGGQTKGSKIVSGVLCQDINAANVGISLEETDSDILQNKHNSSLQSQVNGPLSVGRNGILMQNTAPSRTQVTLGGNGNVSYKSFVGPVSNDLKYAQQYHSFQQQLYATSTRSQQGGNHNTSASTNAHAAAFYISK